jgi:hypothetical protein
MTGEIKITPNSNSSSSFSPVIYLINLFFENIKKAADMMPREKSKKEPVFTKITKPNSTRPNTNNPNLSLDIKLPPELLNFF